MREPSNRRPSTPLRCLPGVGIVGLLALAMRAGAGVGIAVDGNRLEQPDPPAPARTGRGMPVLQAIDAVPCRERPPAFGLQAGTNAPLLGPFAFEEGARVALGGATYGLLRLDDRHFSLRDGRGAVDGPFVFADGAPVSLGATAYTLRRPAPGIAGRLVDARLLKSPVPVHAIPLDAAAQRALADLRTAFARLALELHEETAPVLVPREGYWGPRRPGMPAVIKRGGKDTARDRASAARQAEAAWTRLVQHYRKGSVLPDSNGRFRIGSRPPGLYAVCALGQVRREGTDSPGPEPVIWWAHADLNEASLDIDFNADNALTWDRFFRE